MVSALRNLATLRVLLWQAKDVAQLRQAHADGVVHVTQLLDSRLSTIEETIQRTSSRSPGSRLNQVITAMAQQGATTGNAGAGIPGQPAP